MILESLPVLGCFPTVFASILLLSLNVLNGVFFHSNDIRSCKCASCNLLHWHTSCFFLLNIAYFLACNRTQMVRLPGSSRMMPSTFSSHTAWRISERSEATVSILVAMPGTSVWYVLSARFTTPSYGCDFSVFAFFCTCASRISRGPLYETSDAAPVPIIGSALFVRRGQER